jgi:tetratricopeptide (TPR) repeat protein
MIVGIYGPAWVFWAVYDVARIFLSHSSADNAAAIALRDWLSSQGWDDVFLDLDPERGIAAGERWERALHEAANRCEAVVFLVSRAWLGSRWCLKELTVAFRLSKRMFGVLIEDIPVGDLPPDLTANWQIVRLVQGADHELFRASQPDGTEQHVTFSRSGLKALRGGLAKAGLDPRFFEWPPANDPDRPPFPGMRPLEAEDAGIFFGREAPAIEALDKLRGLADLTSRIFVILGASGAGKSSFLRAGLLPRMARDDRHFMVLPLVRPERAVMSGKSGLITALDTALKSARLPATRAAIAKVLSGQGVETEALFKDLALRARLPDIDGAAAAVPPALVLPIDQGEELFSPDASSEAAAFLTLLARLLKAQGLRLIVVVAMRSDAYEALQAASILEGVEQSTMSLPPMPRGAYATVIEGPAARLKDTERALKIEPALTAALLADLEDGGAKDALPLLAFTLERLFVEHGGDGDLTLAEYRALGGVAGSIKAAVERALTRADADAAVPRDREARLALLRRALIPWMAGIDPETNSPRRRVARLSEIPEEARPLVNHLVTERLLSTEQAFDASGARRSEATIEPVHEALLRQWGLLGGWLEEEAGALSVANGVKRAASEWEANARSAAWLSHQAGRLEDALALAARPDFAQYFGEADRAYLEAARAADEARRDRELEEARALAEARRVAAERQRQVTARTRVGAVTAGLLACAALAAAYFGWRSAIVANDRLEAAISTSEGMVSEIAVEFGKQKSMPIDLVRRVLDRSVSLLDRLAEQSDDPQVRLGKARALTETGYAFRALGDLDSAERVVGEVHALLDTIASPSASLDIRLPRAAAFRLSGDVAQASGNPQAALAAFRSEVDLRAAAAALSPPDARAASELTLARNRLADALAAVGRWTEAIHLYEEQLVIRRRLLSEQPDNVEIKRQIAVSLLKMADSHRAAGSDVAARKVLEEAFAIIEPLTGAEPGNGELARDLATLAERLGDLDMAAGRLAEAEQRFRSALDIRAELATRNPDRADWTREEAVTSDRLARLRMVQEDTAEAKELFQRASTIRLLLHDEEPDSVPRLRDLYLSHINLGDWSLSQGDALEAADEFARALAMSERMIDLAPESKGARLDRALAIAKLAEAGDARGLRAIAEVDLALEDSPEEVGLSLRERAVIAEIERIMSLVSADVSR